MPRVPQSQSKENITPKVEKLIKDGCRQLNAKAASGLRPNISQVARELNVPYGTLRNRFLGITRAPKEAHEGQQLLSAKKELVLYEWLVHLGSIGQPLCKRTIRKRAQDLCGKRPSKNWIYNFLHRHPDIVLSKPSGLDPKRAKAFNWPVVIDYFQTLR
jgi:hypothetical protein